MTNTIELDYEEAIATAGAGGLPNPQVWLTTPDSGPFYESTIYALDWRPNPGGRPNEVSVASREVERLFKKAKIDAAAVQRMKIPGAGYKAMESQLHVTALVETLQGMFDSGFFHSDDGDLRAFKSYDGLYCAVCDWIKEHGDDDYMIFDDACWDSVESTVIGNGEDWLIDP